MRFIWNFEYLWIARGNAYNISIRRPIIRKSFDYKFIIIILLMVQPVIQNDCLIATLLLQGWYLANLSNSRRNIRKLVLHFFILRLDSTDFSIIILVLWIFSQVFLFVIRILNILWLYCRCRNILTKFLVTLFLVLFTRYLLYTAINILKLNRNLLNYSLFVLRNKRLVVNVNVLGQLTELKVYFCARNHDSFFKLQVLFTVSFFLVDWYDTCGLRHKWSLDMLINIFRLIFISIISGSVSRNHPLLW